MVIPRCCLKEVLVLAFVLVDAMIARVSFTLRSLSLYYLAFQNNARPVRPRPHTDTQNRGFSTQNRGSLPRTKAEVAPTNESGDRPRPCHCPLARRPQHGFDEVVQQGWAALSQALSQALSEAARPHTDTQNRGFSTQNRGSLPQDVVEPTFPERVSTNQPFLGIRNVLQGDVGVRPQRSVRRCSAPKKRPTVLGRTTDLSSAIT